MEPYEIVIVGGGPIGCFIAEQVALKERLVVVLEEHPAIGEPLHCAGLVTQRVLDITNCPQDKIVQNTIYGAIIHSPAGNQLVIGGDRVHALVIDRQKFDMHLARKAENAGAVLLLDQKVLAATQHHENITIDIQSDEQTTSMQCQMVIGVDGAYSRIRDSFGFPKPVELLHGISAELSDTSLDSKYVHIFVGSTIAPGFFAWIIPTNTQGTSARIGLCVGKHKVNSLKNCFSTLQRHPLLEGSTEMKRYGGTIPLGPLKQTVKNRVMLVGDAAAQVKPTSGGGLYPGLCCARHCGTVAAEAFQTKRFDDTFIYRYHAAWTNEIGRELSLGMRFRKVFTHLTDAQFDKYLEKLNMHKTLETINTYGDIDYPSRLAFPLIRANPSLLSLAPALLTQRKK